MARAIHKLSDAGIRGKMKPGRHSDGGGLYLNVSKSGNKSWVYLFKKDGAKWPKEMGLGKYPDVSLSSARDQARECREHLAAGRDPIQERKRGDEPSFADAVDAFLASMEKSWRNEKHRAQWRMTLTEYCKPIRSMKVSLIGTDDVLSVLNPIWQQKPETASRLRGRIERVLDYARARGWRTGENPALWRGHLKNVLPAPTKLSRGHHAAMPYTAIPAFMKSLRDKEALSCSALEFLILTAARSGEVLGATWREIDFDAEVWTVPAARMKAGKEHRVPLAERALQILSVLRESAINEYIFPGEKPRKGTIEPRPMSQMTMTMQMRRMKVGRCTVHGFRSSFRDWAGDETNFAREVVEAALAHTVGNATELAYRRSDALAKRRKLMEAWETFCSGRDVSATD